MSNLSTGTSKNDTLFHLSNSGSTSTSRVIKQLLRKQSQSSVWSRLSHVNEQHLALLNHARLNRHTSSSIHDDNCCSTMRCNHAMNPPLRCVVNRRLKIKKLTDRGAVGLRRNASQNSFQATNYARGARRANPSRARHTRRSSNRTRAQLHGQHSQ